MTNHTQLHNGDRSLELTLNQSGIENGTINLIVTDNNENVYRGITIPLNSLLGALDEIGALDPLVETIKIEMANSVMSLTAHANANAKKNQTPKPEPEPEPINHSTVDNVHTISADLVSLHPKDARRLFYDLKSTAVLTQEYTIRDLTHRTIIRNLHITIARTREGKTIYENILHYLSFSNTPTTQPTPKRKNT